MLETQAPVVRFLSGAGTLVGNIRPTLFLAGRAWGLKIFLAWRAWGIKWPHALSPFVAHWLARQLRQ